jgi:hypothetical protein
MNQRERLLAIAVGCLGVVLFLWFGWTYLEGQFRTRRQRIDALEQEIAGFNLKVMQGQMATRKLTDYEAQSLPPELEVAKSLYQDWLLAQFKQAGITDPDLQANPSVREGNLYIKHTFGVTGKGTLPQVVDLLHAFYSADYLHRITNLHLVPIKESKLLDVTIRIDAVSMATAPQASALHTRASKRLAMATKDDYYKSILGRNLFGPPNQAPKLSITGSKDLTINRPASLSAKATDPDKLDSVKYRMIEAPDPEAKLNEATGQFSWTPKKLGKYKLVVEAYDDGLPSKPSRQEIALNVVEPRPEAPVNTGFTGFDQAKYTVLTGVTEVDGEGEIWLHNRTRGQMLKLRVGDEFEIGSIKGVVESIGETEFTFISEGKLHKLEKGESLNQARAQRQSGQTE